MKFYYIYMYCKFNQMADNFSGLNELIVKIYIYTQVVNIAEQSLSLIMLAQTLVPLVRAHGPISQTTDEPIIQIL